MFAYGKCTKNSPNHDATVADITKKQQYTTFFSLSSLPFEPSSRSMIEHRGFYSYYFFNFFIIQIFRLFSSKNPKKSKKKNNYSVAIGPRWTHTYYYLLLLLLLFCEDTAAACVLYIQGVIMLSTIFETEAKATYTWQQCIVVRIKDEMNKNLTIRVCALA